MRYLQRILLYALYSQVCDQLGSCMTVYDEVIVSPVLEISTAQVIGFVQEHVLNLVRVGKEELFALM